jgi:tRNA threonylcarbamoyladenosine modification (KEOPS) complex  Pcc1 subunit
MSGRKKTLIKETNELKMSPKEPKSFEPIRTGRIKILFDSADQSRIVLESLSPEAEEILQGIDLKIKLSKAQVILEIEAGDTSSLRATCNSYLRWIDAMLKILEVVNCHVKKLPMSAT